MSPKQEDLLARQIIIFGMCFTILLRLSQSWSLERIRKVHVSVRAHIYVCILWMSMGAYLRLSCNFIIATSQHMCLFAERIWALHCCEFDDHSPNQEVSWAIKNTRCILSRVFLCLCFLERQMQWHKIPFFKLSIHFVIASTFETVGRLGMSKMRYTGPTKAPILGNW